LLIGLLVLAALSATAGYHFIDSSTGRDGVFWVCGNLALLPPLGIAVAILFRKRSEAARTAAATLAISVGIFACTIVGYRVIHGTTIGNVIAWILVGPVVLVFAGAVIELITKVAKPDHGTQGETSAPKLNCKACGVALSARAVACTNCESVAWAQVGIEFCHFAALSALGAASYVMTVSEMLRNAILQGGAIAVVLCLLGLVIRLYRHR
jgi:hypothetical protein